LLRTTHLLNLDLHYDTDRVPLVLFAALIEFAIERATFDLWIVIVAIVPLLWSLGGRALRSRVDSRKHDHNVSASRR
jgi:hypothetical protein